VLRAVYIASITSELPRDEGIVEARIWETTIKDDPMLVSVGEFVSHRTQFTSNRCPRSEKHRARYRTVVGCAYCWTADDKHMSGVGLWMVGELVGKRQCPMRNAIRLAVLVRPRRFRT
jgi:hypothetical protein